MMTKALAMPPPGADGDGAGTVIAMPGTASDQGKSVLPANPGARRLARELGIDLSVVTGSGKRGRITTCDVKHYIRQRNQPNNNSARQGNDVNSPLPDFSRFGPVRRESLNSIARATSANMAQAWSRIPHAWVQQKIDITELEAWRQKHREDVKQQGGALTMTVILVKAVAVALTSFPKLNSSYDDENNELIYKDYTDIGIAVDTEHGLLAPALRQVDRKGLVDLSQELKQAAEKARARKLAPQDLQGAGITVSNLGGIGLNAIFPIVNWPEVAIVGAAVSAIEAAYINENFLPRRIITVTLGFDHRVINGAEAAKFLVHLKNLLEDARLMLL